MLRYLALTSSIDEIVSAIGSNGYFESEPLIGVATAEGRITIIEGNRRLTALKLLLGERFDDMPARIAQAVERAAHRPAIVPVAIYDARADVLNYLGNKHIAGVKPWGALAKARYARQLFEVANGADFNERARAVARTIGSRTDFITRALKAHDAYEVAAHHEFFDLPDVDEESVKFSLLSTALDYDGIQNFVYDNPDDPVDQRVINQDRLRELFSWMFVKHEQGRTRLGESRNLVQLSRVVSNPDALEKFRRGMDLDQAYRFTDGIDEEFDSIIVSVQSSLRTANSIVAEVHYSEPRAATVTSIERQARNLKTAFDENNAD
ncbi:ParB N-terminal domain-containing protein [Sphingomonas sabuli]|uniref:ParB N-terminal domain-containing protein n=1 Tax=Sphingomonas sabuli TaxID=2764186 RepID=A0A7G9L1A3_9SPHN|nr:ParB N-terminal domain-containing protein [Sphingomonas sabuli]QNM82402.1 ParB N-terminal domain-containing protein [Sphingomonas sabuli]